MRFNSRQINIGHPAMVCIIGPPVKKDPPKRPKPVRRKPAARRLHVFLFCKFDDAFGAQFGGERIGF